MKLPDLNVWLAASWRNHAFHPIARSWMEDEEDEIVFCRITQMGFLRLVTNPAIVGKDALTRSEAWEAYLKLLSDERIFLEESDKLESHWLGFSKRPDHSHKLWTDDYLAAFAFCAESELVTFDQQFAQRYPAVLIQLLKA